MGNFQNGAGGIFRGIVIGFGLAIGVISSFVSDFLPEIEKTRVYSYNDAVEAVLSSNMFSGDKKKAVALIAKNANSEYYKSVAGIVKARMFGGDKLQLIETLNEDK